MSQPEEWTNQRIALLRNHVQEWKNKAIQEAQARSELVAKHQAEKDDMRLRANAIKWAYCLTEHVEHLTNLAIANQQQTQLLRNRQGQETADLEVLIHTESLKNS